MGEPRKVHVGNLSYKSTEDSVRDAFEKYGEIEQVIIVTERDTGRPRGFGFVIFENEQDAKAAIDGLNDSELDGRDIKVSESRPRSDGGGGGGRSYGGRGGGRGRGGYGGGNRYGGGGGYSGDGGRSGGGDRYGGGGGGYSYGSGGGGDYNRSGGSRSYDRY